MSLHGDPPKDDSTADLVATLIAEGEREEQLLEQIRQAYAAGDRNRVWELVACI